MKTKSSTSWLVARAGTLPAVGLCLIGIVFLSILLNTPQVKDNKVETFIQFTDGDFLPSYQSSIYFTEYSKIRAFSLESYTQDSKSLGHRLKLWPLADGLAYPLEVTSAYDGGDRLFIVQQTGEILIYDGNSLGGDPFLDISNQVLFSGEMGLLSLVFHPDYETNGYFYIYYIHDTGDPANPESRLVRYSVSSDPDIADQSSEKIILSFYQPNTNHNGGQIHFGPDGYLYLSLGDGGLNKASAQELDNYLGSILRIDVDSGDPYSIPMDNPYYDNPEYPSALGEIWSYGFRNPWRFSFDRLNGDMYIGDVGEGSWEEINFELENSPGGVNYGWPCYEGNQAYDTTGCDPIDAYDFPIIEYDHSSGNCAVTGGYVYRGDILDSLFGKYIYGDYCSGMIWMVENAGGGWEPDPLLDTNLIVSSFGQDELGELYIVHFSGSNGKVFKIVPDIIKSDFDGDQDTDLSVYKVEPWGGAWYIKDQGTYSWGDSESIPVPGDYDGDATVDVAVYNDGTWYVKDQFVDTWGDASSVPVPADYDGDGVDDIAVFKVEAWGGMWYIKDQAAHGYGDSESIPVPGDYDGDGTTDVAVYNDGTWYVKDQFVDTWGDADSIPVPGDYDGDGTTDLAVFKVEAWGGMWYIKDQTAYGYGNSESIPVPGDYDGDGITDVAVYNDGTWYVRDQFVDNWGDAASYPLPAPDTNGDGDPYQ